MWDSTCWISCSFCEGTDDRIPKGESPKVGPKVTARLQPPASAYWSFSYLWWQKAQKKTKKNPTHKNTYVHIAQGQSDNTPIYAEATIHRGFLALHSCSKREVFAPLVLLHIQSVPRIFIFSPPLLIDMSTYFWLSSTLHAESSLASSLLFTTES